MWCWVLSPSRGTSDVAAPEVFLPSNTWQHRVSFPVSPAGTSGCEPSCARQPPVCSPDKPVFPSSERITTFAEPSGQHRSLLGFWVERVKRAPPPATTPSICTHAQHRHSSTRTDQRISITHEQHTTPRPCQPAGTAHAHAHSQHINQSSSDHLIIIITIRIFFICLLDGWAAVLAAHTRSK